MEYTKAFDLIAGKVEEELKKSGYTKQKVASENEGDLVALFTSDNIAYSVVYILDRQQMVLRSCTMTDEGPDNEWKTLATWLYDEETSSQKDAESIANDFIEGVSGTIAVKRAKQVKQKKKKGDDGNADPKFLAKRFVAYFPELKDEIKMEEDCYYPFRGATFAKEHLAPKIAEFVKRAKGKELEKFAGVFNTQTLDHHNRHSQLPRGQRVHKALQRAQRGNPEGCPCRAQVQRQRGQARETQEEKRFKGKQPARQLKMIF